MGKIKRKTGNNIIKRPDVIVQLNHKNHEMGKIKRKTGNNIIKRPDVIVQLNPMDVLLGRGSSNINNIGNEYFHVLCRHQFQKYFKESIAKHRKIKTEITAKIVDQVYKMGGRFLDKHPDEIRGHWMEITDNVRTRTAKHLQYMNRSMRKKETQLSSGFVSFRNDISTTQQSATTTINTHNYQHHHLSLLDCHHFVFLDNRFHTVGPATNLHSAMSQHSAPSHIVPFHTGNIHCDHPQRDTNQQVISDKNPNYPCGTNFDVGVNDFSKCASNLHKIRNGNENRSTGYYDCSPIPLSSAPSNNALFNEFVGDEAWTNLFR